MNNLKYKLIAADYDYTLANTPDKASKRTTDAIKRYIQAGGYFVVSTGRMTHGIISNLGDIVTNAPLICYQGAKIIDLPTRKIIKEYPISCALACQIIEQLESRNMPYGLYYNDTLHVAHYYDFVDKYSKMNNISYVLVDDMKEFLREDDKRPTKILSVLPAELTRQYEQEFSTLFEGQLAVTRSGANFLEFNDILATKGLAVKYVADSLGIAREQVICFGDSTNDASMIKYAGLGVAMGNAMEELKAVADLVCDTCESDGVAKIIEEYCLAD